MSELHSQAFPKLPLQAVTNRSRECSGLIELLIRLSFFPASCIPMAKRKLAESYFADAKLSEGTCEKLSSKKGELYTSCVLRNRRKKNYP